MPGPQPTQYLQSATITIKSFGDNIKRETVLAGNILADPKLQIYDFGYCWFTYNDNSHTPACAMHGRLHWITFVNQIFFPEYKYANDFQFILRTGVHGSMNGNLIQGIPSIVTDVAGKVLNLKGGVTATNMGP
jgi:hypothetical protein